MDIPVEVNWSRPLVFHIALARTVRDQYLPTQCQLKNHCNLIYLESLIHLHAMPFCQKAHTE